MHCTDAARVVGQDMGSGLGRGVLDAQSPHGGAFRFLRHRSHWRRPKLLVLVVMTLAYPFVFFTSAGSITYLILGHDPTQRERSPIEDL